ncbi:ribonuclease III [Clostridium tepidiprofundi]|uniref:ribonuclease III n=1 Tax=Clostridium tepidiprofundi TaxID=420412 RepID=UPI00082B60BE|nr:ribonuclease III [Clostridium tepidiprofundi]
MKVSSIEDIISKFEEEINIKFNDKNIIKIALTHSSFANERRGIKYNERLEYLGDAVLELIISEYLFNNFKDKSEGDLTKLRALIVCENSLFEIAEMWNLGNYIIMSKGEEATGGRTRTSILADCVEAVIAAVYKDKGIDVTRKFIIDNFKELIKKASRDEIVLDYKTKLQEMLQRNGEVSINYNLLNIEGPAHRPKFYVEINVNDNCLGFGTGYSKKDAEQNAAKKVVLDLEGKNEQ